MSLLGFQRAMAALAASPDLVKEIRADPETPALDAFELTERERRRVVSAAAQRGMVINCTLHRSNRIGMVLAMLPLTVQCIGGEIRRVADLFWDESPNPDFTARRELHRFGRFVRRALDEGVLANPYLREVLDFELHQYDLGMAPTKRLSAEAAAVAERWPDGPLALHPMLRVAAFRHDPSALLRLLREKRPLDAEPIAEGEFYLLLDMRQGSRRIVPVDAAWGRVLSGTAAPDAAQAQALLSTGILVRAAPRDVATAEAPAEEAAVPA